MRVRDIAPVLDRMPLPKTYFRNGQPHYLDPIRECLITVTPEESVRQQVIQFLLRDRNIPAHSICVEKPLSEYGLKSRLRADIAIECYNESDTLAVLCIIECKAPHIPIDDRAYEQATHYADLLDARYVMITNGIACESYCWDEEEETYQELSRLPTYRGMLSAHDQKIPPPPPWRRPSWKRPGNFIEECIEDGTFAEGTDRSKLIPLANLYSALMDDSHSLRPRKYGLFTLLEDYGCRYLRYGNASGRGYCNLYRSFLIETEGGTEFTSIGINAYGDNRTILCIAIDGENGIHHALQLAADTYMDRDGTACTFTHNGSITVGQLGARKRSELRPYVQELYPRIVRKDGYLLGTLHHDRPWYIDDPEIKIFLMNLISYALIRDRFRADVQAQDTYLMKN